MRVRRGRGDWTVRVLLALFIAATGTLAISQSLAFVLRSAAPARAHALDPANGQIAGLYAMQLAATPDAPAAQRNNGFWMARQALRHDPTSIAALVTLAVEAELAGRKRQARRLFAYSDRLSRRDLQTRLWLVEDAVASGDIAGALRGYDVALRTSRVAPELLFPVLARAVSDRAIRTALADTLARRPAWAADFTSFASTRAPDPEPVAALFMLLRQRRAAPPSATENQVVDALVRAGRYGDAWRYYASIRPGADRRLSRNPRFTADWPQPSFFDWQPQTDAGMNGAIVPDGAGGAFEFSAPASVGGPILQQLELLPPGRYLLDVRSSGIDLPTSSAPIWTLTCRDGREAVRMPMSDSTQDGGRFGRMFDVPANCDAQTLRLVLQPSDETAGIEGRIDHAAITPA